MKTGLRVLTVLIAVLSALLLCGALGEKLLPRDAGYVTFAESVSVEEKVEMIYAECREAGIVGEYATAVWLHDWLTHNANYDYTYSNFDASGVLLYGTGVCESYMRAYRLLLNRAGIQNASISSPEMNHTWNVVYLEGKWCHVDVTWDDPDEGGYENHNYFGMSDALIRRDHEWTAGSEPKCESADNYYPIHSGGSIPVANAGEFALALNRLAAEQTSSFSICYVGADEQFNIFEELNTWYENNWWKYYLMNFNGMFYTYSADIDFNYNEKIGTVMNASHSSNGLIYIYDISNRIDHFYIRNLMDEWEKKASACGKLNIRMMCTVADANPDQLAQFINDYPHVTFLEATSNDSVAWDLLMSVGYDFSEGWFVPCVFMISSDGRIIDYASGEIPDLDTSISRFADRIGYDMKLPAAADTIEADAFRNAAFTSADLSGTNITSIQSGAFGGLSELTLVRIPSSVKSIASDAFAGCDKLVIYCEYGSEAYYYAMRNGIDYLTY